MKQGKIVLITLGLLSLYLTGLAWCGGPVGDSGRGPAALPGSTGQSFAPPAASADSASATSGPSITGGLSFGNVAGAHGGSPQLVMSYTNKQKYGYLGRVTYPFQLTDQYQVKLSGDYIGFRFTGNDTYRGPGFVLPSGFSLGTGEEVDTALNLSMWRVSGDILWKVQGIGGSNISIGPRLEWFMYNDTYRLGNVTLGSSHDTNRNRSMFGVGLAGNVCLEQALGSYGSFSPYISFAGSLGKGNKMRYDTCEIFANINVSRNLKFDVPKVVGAEVGLGYMWVHVTEDYDPIDSVPATTGKVDLKLSFPVVKASINF